LRGWDGDLDLEGRRVASLEVPSGHWSSTTYTLRLTPAADLEDVVVGNTFHCLARGTRIAGVDRQLAVEEVKIGDLLHGFDPERHVPTRVRVRDVRVGREPVTIAVGPSLRLTPSHPVHANGRWQPAGELAEGALLLGPEGERRLAGPIRRERAWTTVYDLTVDWPHTFFAAGVLVHNKDPVPARRRPPRLWDSHPPGEAWGAGLDGYWSRLALVPSRCRADELVFSLRVIASGKVVAPQELTLVDLALRFSDERGTTAVRPARLEREPGRMLLVVRPPLKPGLYNAALVDQRATHGTATVRLRSNTTIVHIGGASRK